MASDRRTLAGDGFSPQLLPCTTDSCALHPTSASNCSRLYQWVGLHMRLGCRAIAGCGRQAKLPAGLRCADARAASEITSSSLFGRDTDGLRTKATAGAHISCRQGLQHAQLCWLSYQSAAAMPFGSFNAHCTEQAAHLSKSAALYAADLIGVRHSVSEGVDCSAAGMPVASGAEDPCRTAFSIPLGAVTVSRAAGA